MILLLVLLPLAAAAPAQDAAPKGLVPAVNAEPVYQVLYESGFYQEAVDYLAAKVQGPEDSLWIDYRQYLAYCYVALDQPQRAIETFGAILSRYPQFALNPIQVSPKIYEVFSLARQGSGTVATSVDSAAKTKPAPAVAPEPAPVTALPAPRREWSAAINVLPGGAGQFRQREPARGLVLGLAQAGFLAASIYFLQKRQDYYDPEFGWYSGNQEQNRKYVSYSRVTLGAAVAAYVASVAEAFFHKAKS